MVLMVPRSGHRLQIRVLLPLALCPMITSPGFGIRRHSPKGFRNRSISNAPTPSEILWLLKQLAGQAAESSVLFPL
ncbi:uncharacterized protein BDZ83DRAFT_620592, partial [Colletotrichum acutatum]